MGAFKQPIKPNVLEQLQFLQSRKNLSDKEKRELNNLGKGYAGEIAFAQMAQQYLHSDFLTLYSILLEMNQSYFQIDGLILTQNELILIDTKYNAGNYVYQDGDFSLLKGNRKVKNFLHQLERCTDLFCQFLKKHHFTIKVTSYLVFVHPTFLLYQTPLNFNIIYPGQIESFLKKINQAPKPSPQQMDQLENLLNKENIIDNPFEYKPVYKMEELRKGILCAECHRLLDRKGYQAVFCSKCNLEESLETTVMRHVQEYHVLFPNGIINTRNIFEWCGGMVSQNRLGEIFKKYMKVVGKNRYTRFEFKGGN